MVLELIARFRVSRNGCVGISGLLDIQHGGTGGQDGMIYDGWWLANREIFYIDDLSVVNSVRNESQLQYIVSFNIV